MPLNFRERLPLMTVIKRTVALHLLVLAMLAMLAMAESPD
jgi:hypothetical protein